MADDQSASVERVGTFLPGEVYCWRGVPVIRDGLSSLDVKSKALGELILAEPEPFPDLADVAVASRCVHKRDCH